MSALVTVGAGYIGLHTASRREVHASVPMGWRPTDSGSDVASGDSRAGLPASRSGLTQTQPKGPPTWAPIGG